MVREVIAMLAAMPQDAVCVVNLEKNELANGKTVSGAEVKLAARYKGSPESDGWSACYYPCDDEDYVYLDVVDLFS